MVGMSDLEDLPEDPLERAQLLQNIVLALATGGSGSGDNLRYTELRLEFMQDQEFKSLLPSFVRTCRDLSQLWTHMKSRSGRYQDRREYIWNEFEPLLGFLEGASVSPADQGIGDVLETFNVQGAHSAWTKAIGAGSRSIRRARSRLPAPLSKRCVS
jgi:hypothetical protein